jgi:hypothetical protein
VVVCERQSLMKLVVDVVVAADESPTTLWYSLSTSLRHCRASNAGGRTIIVFRNPFQKALIFENLTFETKVTRRGILGK